MAKYEITEVSPCGTQKGKVMGEIKLWVDIDKKDFCRIIKEKIKGAKCSEDIGVARFEYDGMSVTLFDDGVVSILKGKDKEKINEVAEFLYNVFR